MGNLKKNKALSGPYLAWMIAFIVLPLALVLYYAFTKDGRLTLDNILAISDYTPVFVHSLLLAAIATVICFIIAFPISWMLSRLRAGRQAILLMLVMLPMWMNFLLRTYAWLNLLEDTGLINQLLGFIGLGPFKMVDTSGAIVVGMVYNYVPYMILPLYTIMLKIDNSIIEAAEDLGAGFFHKLFKIQIPLAKAGIKTGIIMVFVPSVSTFAISRLLGGGILMIGDLIEMQFLGNSINYNVGSAMSLVLMIIVLLCMSFTGGFDNEDIEGVV